MADVPFRILPELTERNRFFWTAGERGELCFLACNACGPLIHPPQPLSPRCHAKDLAPRAVSGRAKVHTFTINHQAWMPGPELPYGVTSTVTASSSNWIGSSNEIASVTRPTPSNVSVTSS